MYVNTSYHNIWSTRSPGCEGVHDVASALQVAFAFLHVWMLCSDRCKATLVTSFDKRNE